MKSWTLQQFGGGCTVFGRKLETPEDDLFGHVSLHFIIDQGKILPAIFADFFVSVATALSRTRITRPTTISTPEPLAVPVMALLPLAASLINKIRSFVLFFGLTVPDKNHFFYKTEQKVKKA